MSYPWLCAAFVLVSALVGGWALHLRARRDSEGPEWLDRGSGARRSLGRTFAALGIAYAVLFVLTAVFDNLLIAIGVIRYDAATTSGVTIGAAPIEDFSYPLAAVLLLPALWLIFGARERSRDDD